jgi:hypothetical protein
VYDRWVTPGIHLTRPPHPPVRLDHLLLYKAEQVRWTDVVGDCIHGDDHGGPYDDVITSCSTRPSRCGDMMTIVSMMMINSGDCDDVVTSCSTRPSRCGGLMMTFVSTLKTVVTVMTFVSTMIHGGDSDDVHQ